MMTTAKPNGCHKRRRHALEDARPFIQTNVKPAHHTTKSQNTNAIPRGNRMPQHANNQNQWKTQMDQLNTCGRNITPHRIAKFALTFAMRGIRLRQPPIQPHTTQLPRHDCRIRHCTRPPCCRILGRHQVPTESLRAGLPIAKALPDQANHRKVVASQTDRLAQQRPWTLNRNTFASRQMHCHDRLQPRIQ